MLLKCDEIFLLISYKSESHLKTYKNKLSLVTEVAEPKTSSLEKPRI